MSMLPQTARQANKAITKQVLQYRFHRNFIYSSASGLVSALHFQYSPVGRVINLLGADARYDNLHSGPALIFNENCWFSLISTTGLIVGRVADLIENIFWGFHLSGLNVYYSAVLLSLVSWYVL